MCSKVKKVSFSNFFSIDSFDDKVVLKWSRLQFVIILVTSLLDITFDFCRIDFRWGILSFCREARRVKHAVRSILKDCKW